MTPVPVFPFDIETGPQDLSTVLRVLGEFDPDAVKLGNLTDQKKIDAKIEQERIAHPEKCRKAACLTPYAGKVVAIGYFDPKNGFTYDMGNEVDIITRYWDRRARAVSSGADMAGWNTTKFDNFFLRIRSLLLKLKVPPSAYYFGKNGYLSYNNAVDLMHLYTGSPQDCLKLELVAKALGHPGKNGSGSEFWQLLELGTQEALTKAVSYLENDLGMTTLVAQAAGLNLYVPEDDTL